LTSRARMQTQACIIAARATAQITCRPSLSSLVIDLDLPGLGGSLLGGILLGGILLGGSLPARPGLEAGVAYSQYSWLLSTLGLGIGLEAGVGSIVPELPAGAQR
jgi:hypothetical protein